MLVKVLNYGTYTIDDLKNFQIHKHKIYESSKLDWKFEKQVERLSNR